MAAALIWFDDHRELALVVLGAVMTTLFVVVADLIRDHLRARRLIMTLCDLLVGYDDLLQRLQGKWSEEAPPSPNPAALDALMGAIADAVDAPRYGAIRRAREHLARIDRLMEGRAASFAAGGRTQRLEHVAEDVKHLIPDARRACVMALTALGARTG